MRVTSSIAICSDIVPIAVAGVAVASHVSVLGKRTSVALDAVRESEHAAASDIQRGEGCDTIDADMVDAVPDAARVGHRDSAAADATSHCDCNGRAHSHDHTDYSDTLSSLPLQQQQQQLERPVLLATDELLNICPLPSAGSYHS